MRNGCGGSGRGTGAWSGVRGMNRSSVYRSDRTTGDRLPEGPRGAGKRHRPGAAPGNCRADRFVGEVTVTMAVLVCSGLVAFLSGSSNSLGRTTSGMAVDKSV